MHVVKKAYFVSGVLPVMSTFVTNNTQVGPSAFKGSGACKTTQFYDATL